MHVIPAPQLMKLVQDIANGSYSGHFTIMCFTTNVKFCFGTPNNRDEIASLIPYDNINDAIENAIHEFIKDK